MAALTGWRLDLKREYSLPYMFASKLFRDYDDRVSCLLAIAQTTNTLCWSCLDYEDSQATIELRKHYKINNDVLGF